jgi:hypothetical protein
MPRLLDLFCGAGGAAMGYHRAGFEVVGVDHLPQPRYPFEFHQADALEFLAGANAGDYDAVHASPPCQAHSAGAKMRGTAGLHPDLLPATRDLLARFGLPYVIENVVGAPMPSFVTLCGEMFGLGVIRHRRFECSELLWQPHHPKHRGAVSDGHYATVAGHGGDGSNAFPVWAAAMQIGWMTKEELAQAIPPAYTEWIGRQLLTQLETQCPAKTASSSPARRSFRTA